MMRTRASNREQNPNQQELMGAIQAILQKDDHADLQQIKIELYEQHPVWRVNDKRLAKLTKRVKNNDYSHDEESIDSTRSGSINNVNTTTLAQRARGAVKRLSFRKQSPRKTSSNKQQNVFAVKPEMHPAATEVFLDSRVEITSSFEDEPPPPLNNISDEKVAFFDAVDTHKAEEILGSEKTTTELETSKDKNDDGENKVEGNDHDEAVKGDGAEETANVDDTTGKIIYDKTVYNDDNDYKKANSWAPCEGCIIA